MRCSRSAPRDCTFTIFAITDAIDRHFQTEQADDKGDDGSTDTLAPVG
jgi:hypothetical protein